MKSLGILRLEELYKQQCATYVHDAINNRAPIPVKDLITLNRSTSQINLHSHHNDPNQIRNPVSKCLISSNGFSCKGPSIWNDIPQDIQNISKKHIFKYRLKQHLLNSYADIIVCNNPRCLDRQHHH